MGDPKKQRKKYESPRHPWRRDILDAELRLVGDYGLRNKRELWRYKTMLSKIRGIARSLLAKRGEERERDEKDYLAKLGRVGVLSETAKLDDVLDLDIKDLLERRIQTIVYRTGLARSIHQARQLITHGHVVIGSRVVSIPSYLVKRAEEPVVNYSRYSPIQKADHPLRKAIPPKVGSAEAPPEVSEKA